MERLVQEALFPLRGTPRFDAALAQDSGIVLHTGEALQFLSSLPAGLVTLAVTSPPYNMGKSYEHRQSMEHYLAEQEQIIDQLLRVLHEQGSICWQVGNHVGGGEVLPLDVPFYGIFKKKGLRLRRRSIWRFRHGLHAQRRFSGRYETIMWLTKGAEYRSTFPLLGMSEEAFSETLSPPPSADGPAAQASLGSRELDEIAFAWREWEQGIWDFPNVKANHPEKADHPCQFPVELAERCVLALSREGDWVLDPYCGTGAALVAALMHGRKAIGCDRVEAYTDRARRSIEALYAGTLKTRPMGKPVADPSGRQARPPPGPLASPEHTQGFPW